VQVSERKRFTKRTLDEAKLAREVAKVRRQGWAHNRGEWIDGLSVVAAPVFLGESLLGAVCTALAEGRFQKLDARKVVGRVEDAAAEISERLAGVKR
jgi:IclR family acetate operon transcriptional repressor